jgi:hypothetical protein
MNPTTKIYEVPKLEWHCVMVEFGYSTSLDISLPEIGGTKEEGEW